jgi:hypothetical protein
MTGRKKKLIANRGLNSWLAGLVDPSFLHDVSQVEQWYGRHRTIPNDVDGLAKTANAK